MDSTNSSLIADSLTKYYGNALAIEDVSFALKEGEVAAFLGPNGAGKSTTLRILTALMPATSGRAFVCGQSVAHYPHKIHKYLGYLSENNPLPEDLRVFEYLKFRAKLKGIPPKKLATAVDAAMEACDLKRTAHNTLIQNLSKGYRQRLGIAEAILHSPKVLILDEPTIGLDPHQVLKFRELMLRLKGEMTVLISSHLLAEVETICDSAIIINQGCIIAAGTPSNLKEQFIQTTRIEICFTGNQSIFEETIKKTIGTTSFSLNIFSQTNTHKATLTLETKLQSHVCLTKALTSTNGIELVSYYIVEPKLEDIFLAATKRHWEETSKN